MALEYVHLQLLEKQRFWNELVYMIADGDAAQYDVLKRMDIIEFFYLVDNFKKLHQPKTK